MFSIIYESIWNGIVSAYLRLQWEMGMEWSAFCQAQPQFQLSLAELALVLIPPAARLAVRPAGHLPGPRASSE